VDRVVGLNDVRAEIAMMRTPDGHSRVELTKFHAAGGQSRAGKRAGEHAGHTPHHVRWFGRSVPRHEDTIVLPKNGLLALTK
jgi:hypothetical protein